MIFFLLLPLPPLRHPISNLGSCCSLPPPPPPSNLQSRKLLQYRGKCLHNIGIKTNTTFHSIQYRHKNNRWCLNSTRAHTHTQQQILTVILNDLGTYVKQYTRHTTDIPVTARWYSDTHVLSSITNLCYPLTIALPFSMSSLSFF